jgi:hypothetical protein
MITANMSNFYCLLGLPDGSLLLDLPLGFINSVVPVNELYNTLYLYQKSVK